MGFIRLIVTIWSTIFLSWIMLWEIIVRRWATFCWKPYHLNWNEFHLSCLRFNAPFFLQTKTLQNKMLKLTSRNISSTWQTQSTLLKEWVWTIHLAIELTFWRLLVKSATCIRKMENEAVPGWFRLYLQHLKNILRITKN